MADTKAPPGRGWKSLYRDFYDSFLDASPLEPWVAGVRKIGPWQWGTRKFDAMEHYMFRDDFIESLVGEPALTPRFMISHAGHGTNSYSINVHIVTESAIVFTQAWWGGIYGDGERASREVNDMIESVAAFLEHSERTHTAPEVRNVLIMSNFRGVHVAGTCVPGTKSQDEIETWFIENKCEAPGWFW
jgi:hypothetical protein